MSYTSERLKEIIEKGSEISGNVTGAAIGLLLPGPVGTLSSAVATPILESVFKKIGLELSEKILSQREMVRVGATYTIAINKVLEEIDKGKEVRQDDFFLEQKGSRSKSETIMEGTFLKARSEYEERKLHYYSNFLANLHFNASISFEEGDILLRTLERLSYRQISILSFCEDVTLLNLEKWDVGFKDKVELRIYHDFYSEIMDLYNMQLLQQASDGISLCIDSLKLSPIGKTMCDLIETRNINSEEKHMILRTIESINKIR